MKRLLKWTFRFVILLLLLVAGLVGYVYVASGRLMAKTYAVNVPALTIPTDPASLARGKYLVETVSQCVECHDKDLGGKVVDDNFPMGRLVSANLTRGRGGIGGTYADQDYVRALLHGVRADGRSVTFMPSADFRFSAADAGAVIAYIKSVPPVDRELPAMSIGPMARALGLFTSFPLAPAGKINHETVTFEDSGSAENPAAEGKYIMATAGCFGCHGPELAGGGGPPPGAANITPVGIGPWSEKDFLTALREHKRPDGTTIEEAMPRGYGQMADEDLHKIFSYLKTVPPKGAKSKNQLKAAGS